MARMIPFLSDMQLDALDSQAEAKVYRACRDLLPDRMVVLHRVEWILRKVGEGAADGETDFLLCDPNAGLVTLEVKGGGVRFDPATDAWSSIDRAGREHRIKDPFRQAKKAKFAVLAKLREHRRWPQCGVGKILAGHAVVFPDVDDLEPLCQARIPREIVGGYGAVGALVTWWERVLAFWRGQDKSLEGPGPKVTGLLEEIFAKPVVVRPLVAARLAEEERTHIRLTNQQARILGLLASHRRVSICGGAGTGKTLLAVEKAKRLAREGFRTLLVCFNRPLGDNLVKVCAGVEGLEVASFHSLCAHRCEQAKQLASRDLILEAATEYPHGDLYDVQMPLALAYSVDVLEDRYDAVVVDEGQDFKDEYWFPIELLLADQDKSPLYIFYDQNQALYTKASGFPVRDEPFVLTANCRNTKVIHGVSYRYFRGDPTEPPEINGMPLEIVAAPSVSAQGWKIQALLNKLLLKEGVAAKDIVILVADAVNKTAHYDALTPLPLPQRLTWSVEDHHATNAILVDTVHRFKGLEAAVTVLWLGDRTTADQAREVLYVGTSRAKSLLSLAGSTAACDRVVTGGPFGGP